MNRTWKILETKEEYKIALRRTIEIFNAEENTPESDELDHLLSLVKSYEDVHFPIPAPAPRVI